MRLIQVIHLTNSLIVRIYTYYYDEFSVLMWYTCLRSLLTGILKAALKALFILHSPFTLAMSGSLGGPDPSPVDCERACVVRVQEAQVTSWWAVTNDCMCLNGLALLTFDP